MKGLIAAIKFLTIIPSKKVFGEKEMADSVLYFPLVGLLLGGILALVNIAASIIFPELVSDTVTLITLIVLTGALHLDGFADMIDGFAGGKSKKEILKIMQDNRIGAIGATALVCILLFKFVLLHSISPEIYNFGLLLMPMTGRWAMVFASFFSSPAKEKGLGAIFCQNTKLKHLIVATLISIAPIIYLLKWKALPFSLSILMITLILTKYINKKIGGMTGDTIGAVNEIIEVATLFIMIFVWWNF